LGRGQFVLEDARLRMPETAETLPVTRLAGSYRVEGDVLFLEDLQLASRVGSAVGRGEIHGTGAGATHLFQARWETSEPLALIRPIVSVPGALTGGRLSGSLTIQGGASAPVAHLDGDFTLARARYLPPDAA